MNVNSNPIMNVHSNPLMDVHLTLSNYVQKNILINVLILQEPNGSWESSLRLMNELGLTKENLDFLIPSV